MVEDTMTFDGFEYPKTNFTRIPNAFLEAMSIIDTVGEMKVIYYILRHTWGFQDGCKKITLDEFQHGRKRKDGSRLDNGTGLAKSTIIDGLERAEQHGFIEVEVDMRDKGRIKKEYSLRMKPPAQESDVQESDIGCTETEQQGSETVQRSEKETLEKHSEKADADDSLSGIVVEEIYFRDKEKVTTPGRVYDPPWFIACPSCQSEIRVDTLERVTECHCALGAVILLQKKKQTPIMVPGPLLIYQRLTNKKVPPAWQDEVVSVVGANTDRWQEVVKAYIGAGWNSGNVANMLKYFSSGQMPGERKQKATDEEYVNPTAQFINHAEYEAQMEEEARKRREEDDTPPMTQEEFKAHWEELRKQKMALPG